MNSAGLGHALRDWGRGVIAGFLVIALTFFYTMETWWLGWTLPLHHLLIYLIGGLLVVLLIARNIGFKEEHQHWSTIPGPDLAIEYMELVAQGFIASIGLLYLLGIIEWGDSPLVVLRLAMLEVVPFGFGAALANRLFTEADESAEKEVQFPKNVAIFSLGAIFLAATVSPTAEMELIAAHLTWTREAILVLGTLVVVYLSLYELGFRGQGGRVYENPWYEVGAVFLVYGVSLVISWLLLWSYGHFVEATVALMIQETVVLSFPAAMSGAGAQVVL